MKIWYPNKDFTKSRIHFNFKYSGIVCFSLRLDLLRSQIFSTSKASFKFTRLHFFGLSIYHIYLTSFLHKVRQLSLQRGSQNEKNPKKYSEKDRPNCNGKIFFLFRFNVPRKEFPKHLWSKISINITTNPLAAMLLNYSNSIKAV